jgi:hypothetical protein
MRRRPIIFAAKLLSGIFAVLAAALLLASFAGAGMTTESVQGNADILYGKVASVDTSHATKSLTLFSNETSEPIMNIFVDDNTAVKTCDADKSLHDIRVGNDVQVTYHELAGLAVADFIYKGC